MSHTGKLIPYENLQRVNAPFEAEFRDALDRVLSKGRYILGEEVGRFETRFAEVCGSSYAVGVASGLDALELGIMALDLPPGSEIIVPSNTYIASVLAIINTGHIPVLAEPDPNSYNLSADRVLAVITPRTRAILVVHLYGRPADMDALCPIAEEHGLEIIEDCAQAHGAAIRGRVVGTFGRVGAYSFYPTKNLGALGDAGALVTSDRLLYEKLCALRNYGSAKKYFNKYIGRNSRLDEIQAAFLNIKLNYLEQITEQKRRLAGLYRKHIQAPVLLPSEMEGTRHVYHIYNILTDRRDELRRFLAGQGVDTEIHYPVPPHRQEGYQEFFHGQHFPVSEHIHASTLSLPISCAALPDEVVYVAEQINAFFAS